MSQPMGMQIEYGTRFNPFGWFYGLFIPNCIAQSPIPDSSKLLLGKLFQYAGKDGKAFPSRKQLMIDLCWKVAKLDRVIKALKNAKLIETYQPDEQSPSVYVFLFHSMYNMDDNQGSADDGGTITDDNSPTIKNDKRNKFNNEKEFTNVNSPTSGQESIQVDESRESTATEKRSNLAKQKALHSETIKFLDHWNSFASLQKHKVVGRRKPASFSEQSKIVQRIDASLRKVLNGTYYANHPGIQKGLQKRKFRFDEVKTAIERMALASSPGYTLSTKRISFTNFIHNPHVQLKEGRNKLRYRYPLLHFMNHIPVAVEDAPTKKKTEYPILVDKTIKFLTGSVKINDREHNQVVTQIDKAMVFIKKVSNGNLAENRMKLPVMLRDTMIENKLELTVKDLPLGVYNLEKFMKKRLMIQ